MTHALNSAQLTTEEIVELLALFLQSQIDDACRTADDMERGQTIWSAPLAVYRRWKSLVVQTAQVQHGRTGRDPA